MSFFRVQKINTLLKSELNKIFLRDFDFTPDTLITITRVETSSNLILAKVYISVIPEKKIDEVLRILEREIYDIQQKINKRLKMRPVPKIKLEKENQAQEAGRVEDILEEIKNKEKN